MNTMTMTQTETAVTFAVDAAAVALDEALNTTDYRVALDIIASGVLGASELDYLMDNDGDADVRDAARDALIDMGAYCAELAGA